MVNNPAVILTVLNCGELPLSYLDRSISVHLCNIIELEHSPSTGVRFNGFNLKLYNN
jgi:hypothetical protein